MEYCNGVLRLINVNYYIKLSKFISNRAVFGGGLFVKNSRPSKFITNETIRGSDFVNNTVK